MNGFSVAPQQVLALVSEEAWPIKETFRYKRSHHVPCNEDVGAKGSTIGFNAVSQIDRIADHGKFQLSVVSNITLNDLAVVNTDSNPHWIVRRIRPVPSGNSPDDFQRAGGRVGCVPRACQGESKCSHKPISEKLVY